MTEKADFQPIRKPHHRWLLYSLAVVVAWISIFVFEVVMFSVMIRDIPTPFRIAVVVVALIPALGLGLVLLMGTKMIPWRYGVFGPYECTPPPKGFQPRIVLCDAPRRPQHATRYEVGEEGIEITFIFGSRAFLPVSLITAIGPAAGKTYVVEHDSPEIGSPLVVPQKVGEAIIAGLRPKESS
jgi:hypothetical protein